MSLTLFTSTDPSHYKSAVCCQAEAESALTEAKSWPDNVRLTKHNNTILDIDMVRGEQWIIEQALREFF